MSRRRLLKVTLPTSSHTSPDPLHRAARCYRLTKELLEASGIPLPHAIATLRQCLPRHAILVGQNIAKDVQWLNLR